MNRARIRSAPTNTWPSLTIKVHPGLFFDTIAHYDYFNIYNIMPKFHKEQIVNFIKLKEIVIQFLQGEPIGVIKIRLQVECTEWDKNCTYLYKSMPLDPENDPFIQAILGSLNIKKSNYRAMGHYEKLLAKSKNYHELLKNLYHDDYQHVGDLLTLIDDARPKRNWTIPLIAGTLSGALVALVVYLNKKTVMAFSDWLTHRFPVGASWIKKTFTLLRNVPLAGIIYSGLGLMLSWYRTFVNGTMTTATKLTRLCFKTLTAGLDISAYTLSFFAAGAMSIPGALLSVLSSSTDVFQGVFSWFHSRQAMHKLTQQRPQPNSDSDWATLAEHERCKSIHQRSLSSFMTRLGAAIFKTIAIGIWCFSPPNFFITVCCLSFIALTMLISRTIILSINEASADALQKTIKKIKAIPSEHLCPSNPENLNKLQAQQTALNKKETLLNAFKLKLDQRETELDQRQKKLDQHQKELTLTSSSTAQVLRGLKCARAPVATLPLTSKPLMAVNDSEAAEEAYHASENKHNLLQGYSELPKVLLQEKFQTKNEFWPSLCR